MYASRRVSYYTYVRSCWLRHFLRHGFYHPIPLPDPHNVTVSTTFPDANYITFLHVLPEYYCASFGSLLSSWYPSWWEPTASPRQPNQQNKAESLVPSDRSFSSTTRINFRFADRGSLLPSPGDLHKYQTDTIPGSRWSFPSSLLTRTNKASNNKTRQATMGNRCLATSRMALQTITVFHVTMAWLNLLPGIRIRCKDT